MKKTIALGSALTMALALAACGGGSQPPVSGVLPQRLPEAVSAPKFAHVIVMIQENRSFDNFFATYGHGADGATSAKMIDPTTGKVRTVELMKANLIGRDIG